MSLPIPPWFKLPTQPHLATTIAVANTPVVIIGGGLAGCHIAFELATRGIKSVLVDSGNTIAAGASGNSAGIVKPFVTRSPGRSDQFYQAAFSFLLNRFNADKHLSEAAQFTQCGVLQLVERDYPPNHLYTNYSAHDASDLAGVRINCSAVFFRQGGWLNPAALCRALVKHRNIEVRLQHKVCSIRRQNDNWSIAFEKDAQSEAKNSAQENIDCSTLILANGIGANNFSCTGELPISAARGQSSRFALVDGAALKTVVSGKRYAIPDGNAVVVGASFIRDEEGTQLLTCEHEDNLAGLSALLPSLNTDSIAQSGFCAIRATTPDRLPLVGPMPNLASYQHDYARLKDGLPEHRFPNASYEQDLYIIGGFGSRGIVSSPYCAKLLADYLCSSTDPKETCSGDFSDSLSSWSALLHPGRFKVRDLKRAHQSKS